jgi:glycosyltransferase involved in cell wall biosynthesis
MTSAPKVTVAIPTYNRCGLLRQAVESVLSQDYTDFQVVVLDNASFEDVEAVVRSFEDSRLTYTRNDTNIGAVRNQNRAIELNQSPYLTLLLDDDLMGPGFLKASVGFLDAHPEVAFSFTGTKYIDIDGKPLNIERTQDVPIGVIDPPKYLELHVRGSQCCIEVSSVMMRSRALAEVGVFDSPHGYYTVDLNLWFRLAARFPIGFIPEKLTKMRIHEGQASEIACRSGGVGRYETVSEQIDAISYLLADDSSMDKQKLKWLAERLRSLHLSKSAHVQAMVPDTYFSWADRLEMVRQYTAKIIPPETTFILVDNDELGIRILDGARRAIPFLEKDGLYWGPPPNDVLAIEELEKLRSRGATFIVFAWPTFWWLDHYPAFREYLFSHFRQTLANGHVTVFDLSNYMTCYGSEAKSDEAK